MKIGFSFIISDNIKIGGDSIIGHLSFIQVNSLNFENGVYIGHLNFIREHFLDVKFGNKVWINR